VFLTDK